MPTTLTNGIQLPDKGSVDWYNSMQSNYNLIDTHLGDTDVHVTAEDKANWNSKQGSLSQAQLDAIAQVATNTDDIATLQSGKADASHTHSSSDITDIDDYATKQYVDDSISGLVDNAPAALDTLKELSTALNDDANFASTITTALAAKADSADLATVATSGSYNDLSNKPTINDSTITIQKNGSTVDTFTTNGSAKTIDIPVPAKTSDLTNDSNFVDTSNPAVASGITSAKVTDYDTHIADTDIHVTTADKATWNTVTSKANDSDVVHKSGYETIGGFKQFDNIRVINSIKGINLDSTTTDLNNCYSDFSSYGEGKGGNIQYYYCNTDAGTANISNLPEAKAFFLTSITTRLISNSLYVKQILINSNNKTFTRYCNNSTWSTWVNETDSEYVHKSGNEYITGAKMFGNGTLIVDNSIGSNVHGEIKLNGSRPGYIVADSSTDGVFDNANCGISILLQDVGKPLHIGGYKVDSNGRVFADNTNKNPVLSLTSNLIKTSTLVPENDTTSVVFRILSELSYANGNPPKVLDVRFVQYDNADASSVIYSNDDGKTSLGVAAKRWGDIRTYKVNGVEPSSLSLPVLSNAIDISSYITDLAGAPNAYSPPANGYIAIRSTTANVLGIVENTTGMGTYSRGSNQVLAVNLPVVKNSSISIYAICSSLTHAKFIPCQGNV